MVTAHGSGAWTSIGHEISRRAHIDAFGYITGDLIHAKPAIPIDVDTGSVFSFGKEALVRIAGAEDKEYPQVYKGLFTERR